MNKKELQEFVDSIENFDEMKHPQKIMVYGYYITIIANEQYFDQKNILQCYQLLDDYPPVNISDFLKKLKDGRKIVPFNVGYRIPRAEVGNLKLLIKQTSNEDLTKSKIEGKFDSSKDIEILQKPNYEQSIHSETDLVENYFDQTKVDESLIIIKKFDTLQLAKFRVVGDCLRYDNDVRNKLKNMKQRIVEGVEISVGEYNNYLIWGPPGSGKSYFVSEMLKSLGDRVYYKELNLTTLDQDQFRTELTKLEKIEKYCICFVDEVDSESSGKWAYETMLTYLSSKSGKFRICFILAGSSGSSIDEMKKKIKSYNKGSDLLSRIPTTNEYIIPPSGVGDNIIVGASHLIKAATPLHPGINAVENLALFYIAVSPQYTSPRQINELAARSSTRISIGEDRVMYDHLFDASDVIKYEFFQKAKLLDPSLSHSFILIEDDIH